MSVMYIQRKGTLMIVRWFGDVDQERQELRLVYRQIGRAHV